LTGIYESPNSGVTSILDHAHHCFSNETSLAGLQASVDSGARVWWSFAFHDLSNATWTSPYTRQDQIVDFILLSSQNGAAANSSTVSMGIAYDYWSWDNATQVKQIIGLAKYVSSSSPASLVAISLAKLACGCKQCGCSSTANL
jgi:hypothetical protein